ncbi:hypothetical protein J6590_000402 [Homalodisca vitripennis]|nr:hypothetical protein J6590_000402 [Homalodisca vitripennis]
MQNTPKKQTTSFYETNQAIDIFSSSAIAIQSKQAINIFGSASPEFSLSTKNVHSTHFRSRISKSGPLQRDEKDVVLLKLKKRKKLQSNRGMVKDNRADVVATSFQERRHKHSNEEHDIISSGTFELEVFPGVKPSQDDVDAECIFCPGKFQRTQKESCRSCA